MLVLAMVLSSCSEKYDDPSDYLSVPADDGKTLKTIHYVGKKWRGISVPPRINGKRVTEIGDNTFADLEIAMVNIPKGIKKIGAWSFSGNFITEFSIPPTVTEISTGAFMYNRLSHITIPNSVRKIGYRAFCQNPLTRITIGKNVELEALKGYDSILDTDWAYYAFELGLDVEFDDFYRQNNRRAGTYILQGGAWHFQQ